MRAILRPSLSLLLAAALVTAQTGCASQPVRPQEVSPPAPSLSSIAALGRTGVAVTCEAQDLQLAEPPKGWKGGLKLGAQVGAAAPVVGGLVIGGGVVKEGSIAPPGGSIMLGLACMAAGVALAPVGALVGAVAGAVMAPPAEQVERQKAALLDAVNAANLPTTLRDEIIRIGSEQSWHTLVPVLDPTPEANRSEVGTVLKVVIRRVALEGALDTRTGEPASVWGTMDPKLEVRLEVDVTLFETVNGATLYKRDFRGLGAVKKFSVWVADDGRDFRDGLRVPCEIIAVQIAAALFPGPALQGP